MNDLHRQLYLSALGVESYMPRLHLPYAPVSTACPLPMLAIETESVVMHEVQPTTSIRYQADEKPFNSDALPVVNLIGEFFETKKVIQKINQPVNQPITAADILLQLDSKPITIEPFSLSIWRPLDGVMIVDSRNTKLALPTELLLNNIIRTLFSVQSVKHQEEVLRWPMIENAFTKRTANDARNELQTWLSVQHEIRPIRYLWLMGENAANYLLSESLSHNDCLNKVTSLNESAINGLILPSLSELLQKPLQKKQLFSVLRAYHSAQ